MALQHPHLNWDFVSLCCSTALVAVSNWLFFPEKKRFDGLEHVEPVHAFPDAETPEYNAGVVSLVSRDFYMLEVRRDACYRDGVGDVGLTTSQGTAEDTEPLVFENDSKTYLPKNDNTVPGDRSFFTRFRTFLSTLSTILINEFTRFWHALSPLLFNTVLVFQGSLFAISLQQFCACLKRDGIKMYNSLRALPDKILRFLQRQLRRAVLSLLDDSFIRKEDWTRLQNPQISFNREIEDTMKADQEKVLSFISTLESLAAELREIQHSTQTTYTNSLTDIQSSLNQTQPQLSNIQSSLHETQTALCHTVRRYSTYNAPLKSAFEFQCSRLDRDDVLGHVAALLACVQSEFAHIAVKRMAGGNGFARR